MRTKPIYSNCYFGLAYLLLRAVLALVLGMALLWAGMELVVGVARLAATGCAGTTAIVNKEIGSSASRAEPERPTGKLRPLGV